MSAPRPPVRCHESSLFVPWVIMTDRSRDKSARGSHGCAYTTGINRYLRLVNLVYTIDGSRGWGLLGLKRNKCDETWQKEKKRTEKERKSRIFV